MKPKLLVAIQLTFIALILITGPLLPDSLFLALVEFSGIFIGLWSIQAMGIGNFNVTPTNVQGGHLVERGPYRIIRHPMYASTLLALLPLVIDKFTVIRILLFLGLFFILVTKLKYEESKLRNHYAGYDDYAKRTYRLVPFLW
ncbi:MAG: isoprenylcysteine carboxylmethyltransferase family protein [Candidatus Marinimicrobia bacterium]|nr:isoprenylcysteine carboxylmethyltransferase family protein [Candidatus Neomarinimicrobiota bacterium]